MGIKRKALLLLSLGLFFLVQTGEICWSQTTERVSVDSAGDQALGPSFAPSISENGRYVAFESDSDDLVAGDNNTSRDIFVHDRDYDGDGIYDDEDGIYDPGEVSTVRVSVTSGGAEGSDHSYSPSISGDGMHVAFKSSANDIVAGDNNPLSDIFVHDLSGGATALVSVNSSGLQDNPSSSSSPSISSNGRYVAFQSDAILVADDFNGKDDIYVHDRDYDEDGIYDDEDGSYDPGEVSTIRVSVRSDGTEADLNSSAPFISSDGRYVAFESFATDLVGVGNDTNGRVDIFVHDRDYDGDGIYDDEDGIYDPGEVSTVRVSVNSDGVEAIGGDSSSCSISSDGRYVAFTSDATNLVANDTNGRTDIFVHDRDADGDGIYDDEDGIYDPGEVSTVRVSVDSDGVEAIGGDSSSCSISSDGNYVAFESFATNLVANDTNGVFDIFVYEGDPLPPNTTQSEENNSSANISCFITTAASDWADF